ncbi:uncharacterized protein LOC124291467 [Haliotis rubra]|uniref:uncharacterized protein LOC124291467 n=1 Tax=Haliotis rubra TaxID=36100 RepID=UPI001EE4F329|nr:uncharacterized protein LOC124291467 [Haliotis rubra]
MALGECGRHPLYVDSAVRCIKYWIRLLHLPSHRLPRKAYVMLYNLDNVFCEDHFEPDCFEYDLQARVLGVEPHLKLKGDAVPTPFVHRKRQGEEKRDERRDRLIERKRKQVISSVISSPAITKSRKSKKKSSDHAPKKRGLNSNHGNIEVCSVVSICSC